MCQFIDFSPMNDHSKIDLHELWLANRNGGFSSPKFKILQITISFRHKSPIVLDFGKDSLGTHHFFSLLIGRNGVYKSSLLRALIDFIVDVRNSNQTVSRRNNPITILSLEYLLDSHQYKIVDYNKIFTYSIDGEPASKEDMRFPLVVASTMGMFDKFPVNSIPGRERNLRYDSAYYRYVGPKASNNMFTSKTNVLLHLLSSLDEIEDENQLRKIGDILKYIGYDPKIMFRFKLKDIVGEALLVKRDLLDAKTLLFLDRMRNKEKPYRIIKPDSDSLSKVRKLNIRAIDRLRQEGMLTAFRCCLYKNGEEVECNQLSSGEFNMLSIVLSVILSVNQQHLLVLLDEPEISQHPNWQVEIIDKLDEALADYRCHFLIATHSHFLVSNLPLQRSNIITLEEQERNINVKTIPSQTYGWSAEEVLLKVFEMSTDRNRYLAEIVGKLMSKIGINDITIDEVKQEINFLRKVSNSLSEVDPMKKIIWTIINSFV